MTAQVTEAIRAAVEGHTWERGRCRCGWDESAIEHDYLDHLATVAAEAVMAALGAETVVEWGVVSPDATGWATGSTAGVYAERHHAVRVLDTRPGDSLVSRQRIRIPDLVGEWEAEG